MNEFKKNGFLKLITMVILSVGLIRANMCGIGIERIERDNHKKMNVVLKPNMCGCSEMSLGGINTLASFRPVNFVTDDISSSSIDVIKRHNKFMCNTKDQLGVRSTVQRITLTPAPKIADTTSIETTTSYEQVCYDHLGMETGEIPDSSITGSDYTRKEYGPWKARLNADTTWSVDGSSIEPWIQAELSDPTDIFGVITQGDGGIGATLDWVTSIKVLYTADRADLLQPVTDKEGNEMIFNANTDSTTLVTSFFPEPVYARIVRIKCLTRNEGGNFWNMRFELIGCKM